MKCTLKISFALLLFIFVVNEGYSQYFGEQVMEKSFEQTDFFFVPHRLNPFGIGSFKNSVTGLLNDPVLNLELNPAYLYRDSVQSSTFYVDFRSAKDVREQRDFFYYPYAGGSTREVATILPYPRYFVNTRRELEPVISAAYLFRPTSGTLSNLSVGLTYQRLSQDDQYYPIPQDIYRSVIGNDYGGTRSAGAENIPIVDKYQGTDNIHAKGNFTTLFAGYEVDPSLTAGVKLSKVDFDRSGSVGSQNLWDSYNSSNYTSLWRNGEARSQTYGHWEISGGVNYSFDNRYSVGINGGRLWGDADQDLSRDDSSYYGYFSSIQNQSVYASSGKQAQQWRHDGRTSIGGIGFKAQVDPLHLFQFHYQYSRQTIDIGLGGTINNVGYGMYAHQWDTTVYNSTSSYSLVDLRTGTGSTIGNVHRAVGSLQWDISPKVRLFIGAQYDSRSIETNTNESIVANRYSRYDNTGSYQYSYFDSTAESKTLMWDFQTKFTRFTIPIIFTVNTSETVELMFGLNRTTADWEVKDVTLAIFDYRVNVDRQGVITRRENFGERYTMPQENVSDIRTTLLAGVTIKPSTVFNIRLLVVPNFVETYDGTELDDLQGWIAVTLHP